MAVLRHGAPVELAAYFDKQGADHRFPRYLRLCDVVLSNAHHERRAPSWDVSILDCPMVPGDEAREFLLHLPVRIVRYFARSDEQAEQWRAALDAAQHREVDRYYHRGSVLGEGAFSVVRFGEDLLTRDMFAIKEIDKRRMPTRVGLTEVDIMMRVSHPNVVNTHDIFVSKFYLYLVIEYVQGGELFDIIAEQGHLSERRASQVIRDVITAVRYLHSSGVVHCDIKPENILCKTRTWPLHVKLCDFGLASVVEHTDAPNASMSAMIGTPGYVAPEVVLRKQYGPPVDMWAVGVILYILLSGRMPFYGRTDVETLRRTALGQYSFPEREWRNISSDAKSLVRALLQLNPEKRLTAEAALHHRWLSDAATLPTNPIENDLSGLHSKRRKFRRAARAAILVERMRDLINNSPTARARVAAAASTAGESPAVSPAPPLSAETQQRLATPSQSAPAAPTTQQRTTSTSRTPESMPQTA